MKENKSSFAEKINKSCSCQTLDKELLSRELNKGLAPQGMFEEISATRPHLFSSTMVFLSQKQFHRITQIIEAIEAVIQTPNFQLKVLADAPEVARPRQRTSGVFMGYDFHLEGEEAKLIEINTNAGGALLNAKLTRAQMACCTEIEAQPDFENSFIKMFETEWKLQKGARPLRTIAIIDESPEEQYLYPEFKLFQNLLTQAGYKALIVDSAKLIFQQGQLWFEDHLIDLVYNRSTDFYFEDPKHAQLKEAYLHEAAVITPNPYHHALYANKFNLILLSSASELEKLNVPPEIISDLLSGIPQTEKLHKEASENFWNRRKDLFFKPAKGYGSKASYRGDKVTKKVWDEMIQSDYVAQRIVRPSERIVEVNNATTELKLDIRAYVYQGKIQLLTSRLYSGQTTNFRTNGGGFAPVFITPEED